MIMIPPTITAPANNDQDLQDPSRPWSRGYTVLEPCKRANVLMVWEELNIQARMRESRWCDKKRAKSAKRRYRRRLILSVMNEASIRRLRCSSRTMTSRISSYIQRLSSTGKTLLQLSTQFRCCESAKWEIIQRKLPCFVFFSSYLVAWRDDLLISLCSYCLLFFKDIFHFNVLPF